MSNNAVCKNKNTAISILETITEYIKSDTQRTALKAVADWIKETNFEDIGRLTQKERQALSLKIKTDMRSCMTDKQRREEAAFYLEGI
jgi:hypothetical protein